VRHICAFFSRNVSLAKPNVRGKRSRLGGTAYGAQKRIISALVGCCHQQGVQTKSKSFHIIEFVGHNLSRSYGKTNEGYGAVLHSRASMEILI
jgi:hypothetical protein